MTVPARRGGGPLVALSGICVRFGGEPAVDHVDLEVRPGEIVTLVGPNGSGKTTLVRVALGLLQPGEGSVARAPGLVLGYVPQGWHVEETLPVTVRGFLALAGRSLARRIGPALDEVGAGHLADRSLHGLSGGESRRVLLARALLRDPDLLVLDEPMSAVDITGRAALYELIGRIRDRRGCGVLLVSHDLHLVMAATDRVLCLNRHLCCSGTPESVSRHPEYQALFGPQLGRALAVYTHHHDHVHGIGGEPRPAPQGEGGGHRHPPGDGHSHG